MDLLSDECWCGEHGCAHNTPCDCDPIVTTEDSTTSLPSGMPVAVRRTRVKHREACAFAAAMHQRVKGHS